MDSRRRLSGERGLGIISLRAPGIEAQFERKSLLLDRNPPRCRSRVREHNRHGSSSAIVDIRGDNETIFTINGLLFRANVIRSASDSDYLLCYFSDVNNV